MDKGDFVPRRNVLVLLEYFIYLVWIFTNKNKATEMKLFSPSYLAKCWRYSLAVNYVLMSVLLFLFFLSLYFPSKKKPGISGRWKVKVYNFMLDWTWGKEVMMPIQWLTDELLGQIHIVHVFPDILFQACIFTLELLRHLVSTLAIFYVTWIKVYLCQMDNIVYYIHKSMFLNTFVLR